MNLSHNLRLLFCLFVLFAGSAMGQSTSIVSLNNDGQQTSAESRTGTVSDDGRFVAFVSSRGLLPGGVGGTPDIYIRDRVLERTTRINVNEGRFANGQSDAPFISADGSVVVFSSFATNLVPQDTSSFTDIIVCHRETGSLELVSKSLSGQSGNGPSWRPCASQNGRNIAFESTASDLVPNDSNSAQDIFVRDLTTGTTILASVNSEGEQADADCNGAAISANGRYVVFTSWAGNLTPDKIHPGEHVYWRDLESGTTLLVGSGSSASVSQDGNLVAFSSYESLVPEDHNWGAGDIYVRNMSTGDFYRASVSSLGEEANDTSFRSSISADGRFVVFLSYANNLVEGDDNNEIDVFMHDLRDKATFPISADFEGALGNGDSDLSYMARGGVISSNGRFVVLSSDATNLVRNDVNGSRDVFLRDQGVCFSFTLGDSDCDGVCNNADIDAFILALLDQELYRQLHPDCNLVCNNDMNGDGAVDNGDIDGFVDALLGQ